MKKILSIFGIGTVAVLGAVFSQPNQNAQLYPNPAYTTGVPETINYTELTTVSSCGTYSQCHRKTSDAVKKAICREYPDNCKGVHEVDHFCPLALGCADDIKNLWAQPEHVMVNGKDFGFHTKDALENRLVLDMKAKKITPADAQQCILQDWIACYKKYFPASIKGVDPDL